MPEPTWGSLPFAEQIQFFLNKGDELTDRWTDVWQEAHDRAFMVAGAAEADLLSDLRAAVEKAITQGTTLAEFREDFETIVADRGWTGWTGEGTAAGRAWRTRVIYETNLRSSYAAGRYAQLDAIKQRRPFWRYRHNPTVQDPREEHLSWDGLILDANDPWWRTHYPPNGWGCRCRVESLAQRDLDRLGKAGPDQAPTAPGDTSGIDDGWAYAPGASRVAELKAIADRKRKALGAEALPAAPAAPVVPAAVDRPAPSIPSYKEAKTLPGARKLTQAIIDAPGVDYPKHDGVPFVRFRHGRSVGSAVIKNRYGKASLSGLDVDVANALNQELIEMAKDADRLGIPRLRGVNTVSGTAAASMGDGVLALHKQQSRIRLTPTPYSSWRDKWERELDVAKADLKSLDDAVADPVYGLTEDYVAPRRAHLVSKRDTAETALRRLDGGESGEAIAESLRSTSAWRPGDAPKDRPRLADAYFSSEVDRFRHTLWHEFGHHIHQQVGVKTGAQYMGEMPGGRGTPYERKLKGIRAQVYSDASAYPSAYSTTNTHEWFAECFSLYKLGRRDLIPDALADEIDRLYQSGGQL